MSKWLFQFVFVFFISWVNGQISDSLRIVKYKTHISLAGHLTQMDLNANIENKENKRKIFYRTATPVRLGLSFDYRWMAFEVFTQISPSANSGKGQTRNSGIYFRANRSRYWANLIYQNFKGFYWENANPIAKAQVNNSFPIRPDIRNQLFQANVFFIYSPQKFSNMAAQGENERQLKSGGSFFSGLGYISNQFVGDSTLIPAVEANYFPDQNTIHSIVNRSIMVYSGYAHSFIFKRRAFVSIYLAPGLARYSTINRFTDSPRERIVGEWALRLDSRLAIGYNTDQYFGGILLTSFLNNQELGTGTSFAYGFNTVRIFFGRRFQLKSPWGYLGL